MCRYGQYRPIRPILAALISGLTLLIAACAGPASAQDGADALIAWTRGGELWLLHPGEASPSLRYTGQVSDPVLSPSGRWVALHDGPDPAQHGLRLLSTQGDDDGLRVVGLPDGVSQIAWLDDTALLVNTQVLTPLGLSPREDLYRVTLPDATVIRLSVGGAIHVMPDGTPLVVQAGRYGEADGAVLRLDPSDTAPPVVLLRFPAVASGGHQPFYPVPQPIEPQRVAVAIPAPDALYAEFSLEAGPVTVWHLDPSGEVDPVNAAQFGASSFWPPLTSADGHWTLYARRSPDDPGRFSLRLHGPDGEQVISGEPADGWASAAIPLWWPGRNVFIIPAGNRLWQVSPGLPGEVNALPVALGDVALLGCRAAATQLLCDASLADGGYVLLRVYADTASSVQRLATSETRIVFDLAPGGQP